MNSNMSSLGMQQERDVLGSFGGGTMVSGSVSSPFCPNLRLVVFLSSFFFFKIVNTADSNPQEGVTAFISHQQNLFTFVCFASCLTCYMAPKIIIVMIYLICLNIVVGSLYVLKIISVLKDTQWKVL